MSLATTVRTAAPIRSTLSQPIRRHSAPGSRTGGPSYRMELNGENMTFNGVQMTHNRSPETT